jgi:hypothetical protein
MPQIRRTRDQYGRWRFANASATMLKTVQNQVFPDNCGNIATGWQIEG